MRGGRNTTKNNVRTIQIDCGTSNVKLDGNDKAAKHNLTTFSVGLPGADDSSVCD